MKKIVFAFLFFAVGIYGVENVQAAERCVKDFSIEGSQIRPDFYIPEDWNSYFPSNTTGTYIDEVKGKWFRDSESATNAVIRAMIDELPCDDISDKEYVVENTCQLEERVITTGRGGATAAWISDISTSEFWKDLWHGVADFVTKEIERKVAYTRCEVKHNEPDPVQSDPETLVRTCDSAYSTAVSYKDRAAYRDEKEYLEQFVIGNDDYKDTILSKKYCNVYCYEDVTLNKIYNPNNYGAAIAGRYVDLSQNSNILGKVSGSRTCYSDIDINTFNKDMLQANKAIADAYLDYKHEQKREQVISNPIIYDEFSQKSKDNECECKNTTIYHGKPYHCCVEVGYKSSGETCTKTTIYYQKYEKQINPETGKEEMGAVGYDYGIVIGNECAAYTGRDEYRIDSCTPTTILEDKLQKTKTVTETCKYSELSCTKEDERRYEYYTYEQVSETSINYNGSRKVHSSDSYLGHCVNNYNKYPTSNVKGKLNAYNKAINDAQGIANKLKSCYSFDENNLYNLEPNLNIAYYDGNRYEYQGELAEQNRYSYTMGEKYDNGLNFNFTNVIRTSCSGNSCTSGSEGQYTGAVLHKSYQITKYAEVEYVLNNGVYNYISKVNAVSSHIKPIGSYIKMPSNLPISYNANNDYNYLNVYYSKLGHSNSSYSYTTRVDNYLSGNYADYGKWECDFEIKDGLITDKGLNAIYRPISLTNPFPGFEGKGRNTGSNWCDGFDCSNTNEIVKDVITDKQDIYSGKPMYSFTLTPQIIKAIRAYNKTHSYTDFNLKCNENGNACVSEFITSLINGNLAGKSFDAHVSGTCVEKDVRNKNFYGCQP